MIATWSLCILLGAAPAPAIEPETPKLLDRRWEAISKKAASLSARGCAEYALEAGGANLQLDRIAPALEIVKALQDRDPKSETYGNSRWYWGSEKITDRNAVEFVTQQLVLLHMLYRDRLTPEARRLLDDILTLNVEGVRRHKVREGYTNIFLMKCWNLIALGETLEKPEVAAEGYAALDRWLEHTRRYGVCEYLSPTYYGINLESLGLIARFAKQPAGRAKAEKALAYFWTEIAANWYEPGQRLGGAHSRDYDYLTGRGVLDRHLVRAGWVKPANANPPGVFNSLCAWVPADDPRSQVTAPRFVTQRWGEKPFQQASQYVGHKISLGSAGATYHNMDKTLVVNLPGGPKQAQVFFLMDGRGDAYGNAKILERSGHMKSLHLFPFVASVQNGPEALFVASDDAETRKRVVEKDQLTGLMAHFVFPTSATVWVAGAALPLAAGERREIQDPLAPVFLRFEDTAVAIRPLLIQPSEGSPARLAIVADGPKDKGAARMTWTLSPRAPTGRGTVAFWVAVAEGLDGKAFADFRSRVERAAVSSRIEDQKLTVGQGEKQVVVDLARRELLQTRGAAPGTGTLILGVNGQDRGREILGAPREEPRR